MNYTYTIKDWNRNLDHTAWMQGWGLFTIAPGKYEIQCIDILEKFDSDDEALAFVKDQAAKGDTACQIALEIVGESYEQGESQVA
jgi:hypothetical protein